MDMSAYANHFATIIQPLAAKQPLYIAGLSFGPIRAFALAKQLEERDCVLAGVIAICSPSPRLLPMSLNWFQKMLGRDKIASISTLECPDLIEMCKEIGLIAPDSKQVARIADEAIRYELQFFFHSSGRYLRSKLRCHVVAIAASDDPIVPDSASVWDWRSVCSNAFSYKEVGGGHMVMRTRICFDEMIRYIPALAHAPASRPRTLRLHLGAEAPHLQGMESHMQIFVFAEDNSINRVSAARERGIIVYDLRANLFSHHVWDRDRPKFAGILEISDKDKGVALAIHAETFKSSYGRLKVSSSGIVTHDVSNSWHPNDVGDIISFSRSIEVQVGGGSVDTLANIIYNTAPTTALGFPVAYEELALKALGVKDMAYVSQIDGSYSLKYHYCNTDDGFCNRVNGLCMLSLGHGIVSMQISLEDRERMQVRGCAMDDDFTESRVHEWMGCVGTIYEMEETLEGDLELHVHIEQCSYPLWFCTGDDISINIKVNESKDVVSIVLAWDCTLPFMQVFEKSATTNPTAYEPRGDLRDLSASVLDRKALTGLRRSTTVGVQDGLDDASTTGVNGSSHTKSLFQKKRRRGSL